MLSHMRIAALEASLDCRLQFRHTIALLAAYRTLGLTKDRLQRHQPRRFHRQVEQQHSNASFLPSLAVVLGYMPLHTGAVCQGP